MKVLLVEDDPDMAASMQRLLTRENHVVDVAGSLSLAQAALSKGAYDIVLLDRRLPDGDGTELVKFVRRTRMRTRFIIVSALSTPAQRVEGLDLGADDYIAKPFDPAELIARIRAVGRRPLPEISRVVKFGNVRWDAQNRNFTISGQGIMFPRRELIVMEKLMEHAGRVVTRDALEAVMYGYGEFVQSNTLESHMSRLRKRLVEGSADVCIHTVRGVGYMLCKASAPP